jgi:hypothetical protein
MQLIISAISQSFIFSQTLAYNQEIVDGGTNNRIWSFMSNILLVQFAFFPIMQLLPFADLSIYQYPFMALAGLIQYIASIAHQNQMAINENKLDKIQELPFHLEQNHYLMNAALFFSKYFAQALQLFYMISLVLCLSLGAPVYAYTSLALLSMQLLNQRGYLPEFIQTAYLYVNLICILLSVFGITSMLGASLSIGMVAFTIGDYISCHLFGETSPTAQFPMTDPNKKLTIHRIDEDNANAEQQVRSLLDKHIKHRKDLGIHVTFDHFYQSHEILNRILSRSSPVNYQDYISHFNSLDFNDSTLKTVIENEMCLDDKFHECPLDERCKELGLPQDTHLIDIQIAYLKREMTHFVERLTHPSYRDLTHLQVATIHNYSRLLLTTIQQQPADTTHNNSLSKRAQLLISIATRTGSHCNRAYLETLSELAEQIIPSTPLTRHEEVIMMTQTVRENAFRQYYYKTAATLKSVPGYFQSMWDDVNDYHTYEDFVNFFGSNFYLRNPALMMRFRTVFDIFQDRFYFYYLNALMPELIFSNFYNKDYLIKETVNADGKLHPLFLNWCEEKFPSCYETIVYDEYYLLNTGESLDALAELMLLDMNVLGLSHPYPEAQYLNPPVRHQSTPINWQTKRPEAAPGSWSAYFFKTLQSADNTQDSNLQTGNTLHPL